MKQHYHKNYMLNFNKLNNKIYNTEYKCIYAQNFI